MLPEHSKKWKADPRVQVQDRIRGPSHSKFGIMAQSYPVRKLTKENFNEIKQAVEKLIAEQ
jgi:hypothetical protein